jgi:hypothetical protein
MQIAEESPYRFVISRHGRMRVPGVVFATRALIPDPAEDRALQQAVNVAELPGIVEASYAMPDVHWGYGFPIGGGTPSDRQSQSGPQRTAHPRPGHRRNHARGGRPDERPAQDPARADGAQLSGDPRGKAGGAAA